MKRQTILGTLAALALAIVPFLAASPAHATVTCMNVDSQPGYPHGAFTKYCGTASLANGQSMRNAVAATAGTATGEMRTAYQPVNSPGVVFYLFKNPADYALNFPAPANPQPGPTDFGITVFDGAARPAFTAIFEVNSALKTNAFIANTTAHEVGVSINALMGYVMNGGVVKSPYPKISDTTVAGLFNAQLTSDWNAFALLAPCNATGSGVFNSQADPTKPPTAYICNGLNGNGAALNAAYVGKTNKQILQAMWPNFASADKLLAEEYAYITLNIGDVSGQPYSQDRYIKSTGPQFQFACSSVFIKLVTASGTIPNHTFGTTDAMPSACPTVSASNTKCIKQFTGRGHYPDGRVFDCGAVSGVTADVKNNLDKFGRLGGVNNDLAPVKLKLDSANSFVYMLVDNASFQSIFTGAGVSLTNITLTNRNGITFPIGALPVWYSAMNSTSSSNETSGVPNAPKITYTTAHELGHVLDNTLGQPHHSADQVAFDLAMQNDFLYMDFTDAAGTQPRLGCAIAFDGYIGPFTNSIDPTTGNAFCDGAGNFTTAEAALYRDPLTGVMFKNSKIFEMTIIELKYETTSVDIGNSPKFTVQPGWIEWFAQAFAMVTRSDLTSVTNRPSLEQALLNGAIGGGYFGCTAGSHLNKLGAPTYYDGWLEKVYETGTNTTIASLPAACKASMPAGYVEVQ